MEKIENAIREDLHQYLHRIGRVDARMPECPDLDDLWESVLEAYLPDGVREYNQYPVTSLGWMMFIGMALAYRWDEDWEAYGWQGGKALYVQMRDAQGYDMLDDYVLRDILGLDEKEAEQTASIVGECAARVFHTLQTCGVEPGTREAVLAYVGALHQLYLLGIAFELNDLGYHMTRLGK